MSLSLVAGAYGAYKAFKFFASKGEITLLNLFSEPERKDNFLIGDNLRVRVWNTLHENSIPAVLNMYTPNKTPLPEKAPNTGTTDARTVQVHNGVAIAMQHGGMTHHQKSFYADQIGATSDALDTYVISHTSHKFSRFLIDTLYCMNINRMAEHIQKHEYTDATKTKRNKFLIVAPGSKFQKEATVIDQLFATGGAPPKVEKLEKTSNVNVESLGDQHDHQALRKLRDLYMIDPVEMCKIPEEDMLCPLRNSSGN